MPKGGYAQSGGAGEDDPLSASQWSGYGSDQGEPGDADELQGAVADTPGDDRQIKADVCAQMAAEAELDARDVAIDVVRGEVVLQGSVGAEAARRRAELIARGAPGVRAVRNELEVRTGELPPPAPHGTAAESPRRL